MCPRADIYPISSRDMDTGARIARKHMVEPALRLLTIAPEYAVVFTRVWLAGAWANTAAAQLTTHPRLRPFDVDRGPGTNAQEQHAMRLSRSMDRVRHAYFSTHKTRGNLKPKTSSLCFLGTILQVRYLGNSRFDIPSTNHTKVSQHLMPSGPEVGQTVHRYLIYLVLQPGT